MHEACVPSIVQMIKSLNAIIDKANAHCEARKIDPAVLVNFRLAPDMFPFSRQIQIVSDQAKGVVARLAGVDVPAYPDSESTFAELKERLNRTLAFVKSVSAEKLNGSEDKDIVLKIGGNEMQFKGRQYLCHFFYPNFYFHAATAYDILRHCGVDIGKRDFLGQ
jgi:hypothetical protein